MTVPRYLSGDAAGIREFLDKFDVRLFCGDYPWQYLIMADFPGIGIPV
jgi:hypothetical protein